MPLLGVSPNIQESESLSRKRSHEAFADDDLPGMMDVGAKRALSDIENIPIQHTLGHLPVIVPPPSPPVQSSPGSMTDAGSSTPARHSPSPNLTPTRTPAAMAIPGQPHPQSLAPSQLQTSTSAADTSSPQADTTTGQPPAKRKKLTTAEKEEKAKAEAAKKQEREQAKAAKDAEKARVEAEKKARVEEREKEREKKRKEKEEEDRKKAEEKDRKRREKEEEERKAQEAKEKKERSQMRLNSFFKTGPSTPSKKNTLSANKPTQNDSPIKTPQKTNGEDVSEYEKRFKPFFVKDQVSLGQSAFAMDDETKNAKSRILDEHLRDERGPSNATQLTTASTVDYFHLPALPPRRGRQYPSVRKVLAIMSDIGTSSTAPMDLTSDSQNAQIKMTRDLLKKVPMKFLGFREDVRPPYHGTITSAPPHASLNQLARNPISKQVLPLNYDYDSEAEWVDDGDGEDVDLMDDDEEELDEDEEMGDFLDDEEDQGPLRHAFVSGIEPESTGLCWENQKRLGPLPHMYKFRMEFMLGTLEHHHSIDPFSSQYWEPEAPKASKATKAKPSPSDQMATISSTDSTNPMPPPPNHSDAFSALLTSANKADPKTAQIPAEMAEEFKEAILKYEKLTKVGLVEILSSEFTKCTKNQIKNSVDSLAERVGKGMNKVWRLKA